MTRRSPLLAVTVVCALTIIPGASIASERYPFSLYATPPVYAGKTKLPSYNGRDKEYRSYRTRINNALSGAPGFASRYSFVQFGCGTSCSIVFLADHKTGQVHSFPMGGEDNPELDLQYASRSSLVVAHWKPNPGEDGCVEEQFVWRNDTFDRISRRSILSTKDCGPPKGF